MEQVPTQERMMPVVSDRLADPVRMELEAAIARLRRSDRLLVRIADLIGMAMDSAGGLAAWTVRRALRTRDASGENAGGTPELTLKLQRLAHSVLEHSLNVAMIGLGNTRSAGTGRTTRAAVVLSGAVGGFYGMAGFVPDAAFTTLAVLREIGRVAQQEGEELTGDEARRACLDVFLLSPRATLGEPEGESRASYLASRLVMQGRPMVALLEQAAARYGLALSEKFAAQAVPVVGAVCGAAVNNAFLAHYREVARAYFTVRRLMRMHGKEQVMAELSGIYAENRRDPLVQGAFQ